MAFLKLSPAFTSLTADLTDGAFRLLLDGCYWSINNRTDWIIPAADIYTVSSTYKAGAHAELLDEGWWQEIDDAYLICTHGPHNRMGSAIVARLLAPRSHIPGTLSDLIYERDGRICCECGSLEDLSIDHIYPWSKGGTDAPDNLRVLCRPCNSRKGGRV